MLEDKFLESKIKKLTNQNVVVFTDDEIIEGVLWIRILEKNVCLKFFVRFGVRISLGLEKEFIFNVKIQ